MNMPITIEGALTSMSEMNLTALATLLTGDAASSAPQK